MSRRNNNNKIGWIILAIIIFGGTGFKLVGGLILGLGGLLVGGIGLLLVMAAAIGLLKKLIKGDDYAEVKRNQSNRPTANPYSKTENRQQNIYSNKQPNPYATQTAGGVGGAAGQPGQTAGNPYSGSNTSSQPAKEAPKPPVKERKSTGDPDLDKMIDEKDKAIAEMHRLNDSIEDEKLSEQIDHLEAVTDKIVAYVVKHPKKKKQVSKFFNYYLPTTLKLLNAYDRMDDAGISGTNIDGTKGKVEDMMGTALQAFDKQLDALFAEEALDVSTDISVMENMLRSEGLMDDELMNEAKELAKSLDA